MQSIPLDEKTLNTALHQFIFPFSMKKTAFASVETQLLHEGFVPFCLSDSSQETAFYGPHHAVSHHLMESMFLPYTNYILFPDSLPDREGFQRYSKTFGTLCLFQMAYAKLQAVIRSVDVILCPFDVALVTIRTEVQDTCYLSHALEFAKRFRSLQNRELNDRRSFIHSLDTGSTYRETREFMSKELTPGLFDWIEREDQPSGAFEKLPFLINERMFTIGFYALESGDRQSIHASDLFRSAKLNGIDEAGNPFIRASDLGYVKAYTAARTYTRWAPHTYYIADEHVLSCMTNASEEVAAELANEMYGRYYYAFILNLFHKIVLLKLSNQHVHLQVGKNEDTVKELIRDITLFSSKYYFREMAAESQLRDIFCLIREQYGNDALLNDVKRTLSDLYEFQANTTGRRSGYMLQILTIYTVISGIYGMNQIIDDLEYPMKWKRLSEYSFFEYLAMGVIFSGIAVSITLAVSALWHLFKELQRRRDS